MLESLKWVRFCLLKPAEERKRRRRKRKEEKEEKEKESENKQRGWSIIKENIEDEEESILMPDIFVCFHSLPYLFTPSL